MRLPNRLTAPRWRADRPRTVLVALVLLAALAAGWFGWSWWSAAHDEGLERARARDAVLAEAGEAVVALNTVDYRTAKADITHWAEVSTGAFGRELADQRKDQVQRVKKSQTVTTAELVSSSVTELRPRKGAAKVMAVLNIEVDQGSGKPRSRHSLLEVELTDTANGWKVRSVQAAR